MQVGNNLFPSVSGMGIALGISSGAFKGIIRHHLPQAMYVFKKGNWYW